MSNERRKFARLGSQVQIRFAVVGANESTHEGLSKNIGSGGLCISFDKQFAVGTRLRLEISLPNQNEPLTVSGVVAWQAESQPGSNTYDTGIQYMDISFQDMNRLTNYLLCALQKRINDAKKTDKITLTEILTKEIRIPGDTSQSIQSPDFLIEEFNMPGDRIRYCRVSASVKVHYKLSDIAGAAEFQSISQFLSGSDVWLLLDRAIEVGTKMFVRIDLPGQDQISSHVEVVTCRRISFREVGYDMSCFEAMLRYTDISFVDRKRIIRYVYSFQKGIVALKKAEPPRWLSQDV